MAAWYGDIFLPYFTGERVSFCSSGNSQLAADYVVFYVNHEQRQKPGPGLVAYFQVREPSYTASVKGADWAWIYPAPHMMYEVRGKSQIEGRAWLPGYSTIDKPCLGAILPVTLSFACWAPFRRLRLLMYGLLRPVVASLVSGKVPGALMTGCLAPWSNGTAR